MLIVVANQATTAKRRVFFQLVNATDGFTSELGEAGGQPQISIDGAGWADAGIGVLVAIGEGRYYAELTQATCAVGTEIETRYKSVNTREAQGTSVRVVAYDPDSATTLGLSRLDEINDLLTQRLDANVSSAAPASTALSTSVWTSARAALLDRIAGLLHDNVYVDTIVATNGPATSARVRIYDSAANAATHGATGLLYTYTMSATYTGAVLTSYSLVRA